jgi:hypothetical protein
MNECAGEFAARFMAECCFRTSLTVYLVVIEYQIVQRRDVLITHGRKVQNMLHLPKGMCVFSEEDPGMPDDDIRVSAMSLSISFTLAILAILLVACTKATVVFWDPWILGFVVVNPICVTVTVWLLLALSKRKRAHTGGRIHTESAEKNQDSTWKTTTVEDSGANKELRLIWTTPMVGV